MRQTPGTVFHYTSAQGLIGILEGQKLWASDVEFLNDAEELRYAASALRSHLQKELEETYGGAHPHPDRSPRHRNLQALVGALGARFGLLGESEEGANGAIWESLPYTSSFCRNGDLLSMWRGYGDSGGFAIEFDTEVLLSTFSDSGCSSGAPGDGMFKNPYFQASFESVVYGDASVRSEMEALLEPMATSTNDHVGVSAFYFAGNLSKYFVRVKHPAFVEEQEVRLVMTPTGDLTPMPKLRRTDKHLVPYQEVNFPIEAIRSIVVGPSAYQDRNIRALQRRLNYSARGNTAQLVRSEVPLI